VVTVAEDLVDHTFESETTKRLPLGPVWMSVPTPKISSKKQAFTLGDLEFARVVGNAILESWIVYTDLPAGYPSS